MQQGEGQPTFKPIRFFPKHWPKDEKPKALKIMTNPTKQKKMKEEDKTKYFLVILSIYFENGI
ncbi:MAG: hypothetical protein ACNA7V_10255 [Bacteroidales bacterium]